MPSHKRIAYIDCFSGISGDMCLGAIVDAGLALSDIKEGLRNIPIEGYDIRAKKVLRNGISTTKVDVILNNKSEVRRKPQNAFVRNQISEAKKWKDIEKIIKASSLPDKIRQKGLCIFKKLFEVEAKIHGKSFDKVHLHELGAVDCIVDIFGTLIGLDIFEVEKIFVSPINLGRGMVKTDHGMLPVPAPATLELLKTYPIYSSDIEFELTTPTGAAIIAGLDAKASSMPEMIIQKIGYGAGNKDFKSMPNTLRILVGEEPEITDSNNFVTIIETNIDDMNPQFYEHVMQRLFEAGALDVFLENIIMKKCRPAVKLSIMAKEKDIERLSNIIFEETTTIGLRLYKAHRMTLDREIKKIKTKYGDVRIKVSKIKGSTVNISPEYEDLLAISKNTKIPLKKLAEIVRLYCIDDA